MLVDIVANHVATHEVWVVVGNDDVDPSIARELHRSARLVRVGRPLGSPNPWHLVKLILKLRQIDADVIHAHQESFGRLKRFISAPMILTVHNTRLPLGRDINRFDAVFAISEAVKSDVLRRIPKCAPHVIDNGIDFALVKPKRRYGGRRFRIVQIGRLAHEQKGQDILIRALRDVLDRESATDVSVDFIGTGDSLGYLRRLSIEFGVEHNCRFLGLVARQDIYDTLKEYDLLIQPSRYEGFGLSVVEGIAAGVPVLVCDTEGPLEIIAEGQLGWSFRAEDTRDLATKISELMSLSQKPCFADQMRLRIERAKGRFDISVTAESYLQEYAKLV